jgi:wyosine [tRNA(Phe)-imidazoG37] synthetase (radical SAM superfamily)
MWLWSWRNRNREAYMKYLFGPVNSRRLGISLGIDLLPHKTCSLDCLYCECGPTTAHTSVIDEYVPAEEVLAEIDDYLGRGPELDVVTFSGSGEPTMHRDIGRIIAHIKDRYPRYRVVVLTNGTLLWREEVRRALMRADIVVPSLDAVSPEVFSRMLRPAPGISAELLVQGLKSFGKEYQGMLDIEVFLIPGINDSQDELEKIKALCLEIGPDMVQLNRLDRPGAVEWVKSMPWERMVGIKEFLAPLPVEIIGRPDASWRGDALISEIGEAISATLRRRPSTAMDLSQTLGLPFDDVTAMLEKMLERGILHVERMERGDFYHIRAEKETR